jgi:hypothetical protein
LTARLEKAVEQALVNPELAARFAASETGILPHFERSLPGAAAQGSADLAGAGQAAPI